MMKRIAGFTYDLFSRWMYYVLDRRRLNHTENNLLSVQNSVSKVESALETILQTCCFIVGSGVGVSPPLSTGDD